MSIIDERLFEDSVSRMAISVSLDPKYGWSCTATVKRWGDDVGVCDKFTYVCDTTKQVTCWIEEVASWALLGCDPPTIGRHRVVQPRD